MKLEHRWQLAYCTNVHRGGDWAQTFESLQRHTLAVRERVCPGKPYAIGLRLGDQASRELSEPAVLATFQRWLEKHDCYVFTINGFPYGQFHGTRVKEQVYAPDWTTPERLAYTNRLFELLARLVPEGMEGSVSTVPCSFKEFITTPEQIQAMRDNLWRCVEQIARLSERSRKWLHLGLEPEPLCYLETSAETAEFFERMRADRPGDERLARHLGVNYDTCHLAVEFESPQEVLERFRQYEVRISKVHLSSALAVVPTAEARQALAAFVDSVYFHQVVARQANGTLQRYRDLDEALARSAECGVRSAEYEPRSGSQPSTLNSQPIRSAECGVRSAEYGSRSGSQPSTLNPQLSTILPEWRIHFHVPLHSRLTGRFENTTDHLLGVLDLLGRQPGLCSHFEMETYTWEVLPPELKQREVVEQLVCEYDWLLRQLARRGIHPV